MINSLHTVTVVNSAHETRPFFQPKCCIVPKLKIKKKLTFIYDVKS